MDVRCTPLINSLIFNSTEEEGLTRRREAAKKFRTSLRGFAPSRASTPLAKQPHGIRNFQLRINNSKVSISFLKSRFHRINLVPTVIDVLVLKLALPNQTIATLLVLTTRQVTRWNGCRIREQFSPQTKNLVNLDASFSVLLAVREYNIIPSETTRRMIAVMAIYPLAEIMQLQFANSIQIQAKQQIAVVRDSISDQMAGAGFNARFAIGLRNQVLRE
ncbi:MAG: hypothetical protein JWM11_4552 [Planctomycetaceae bacterium]|nr:hypothetical protein [Planctomycetaceae bacterium]